MSAAMQRSRQQTGHDASGSPFLGIIGGRKHRSFTTEEHVNRAEEIRKEISGRGVDGHGRPRGWSHTAGVNNNGGPAADWEHLDAFQVHIPTCLS